MTEEAKLIKELAPAFAYLIASILLIVFVRRYLFVA